MSRILLFANTDWYIYNFRFSLAQELRNRGHEVLLLSPPGDFHELMQADGFQWIPFPLSRQSIKPFGELWTIWHLIRLYRRVHPDIVHHFTIKPVIYGSLAAHVLHIPGIINSITGLGHLFIDTAARTRLLRTIAKGLYRISLRRTQAIFENPEDRMGTGVDVKKFHPTPKNNGTPVVLFSSRMLVTKGLLEFMEATRLLKQKGIRARFALAGRTDPGNPASIPEEQIDIWKDSGLLEWWGWRDDMPSTLAQADVFCLPSYREGVPNALLEAAACGLPIVTTDVPGCRDVVTDGLNGLLVPVRNVPILADALETLLSDARLRHEMGTAGREIAVNKFGLDKVNEETLMIYQRFL
jgi:glycosyltransferase involved in cell wall biosynthesis